MPWRPDIDGLRALAVLWVVLHHAGLAPGGYLGVDVFFVISGLLIGSQIDRGLTDGTFGYRAFWARRIRRLAPVLLLVVGTNLVLAWQLAMPNDLRDIGRATFAQSFLSSNVYFWLKAGYWDTPALTKPLLHLWTLAVEEQFYLVLPLLLGLTAHRARAVAVLTVLSFGSALMAEPSSAFFLFPFRAWELGVGVLLALRPPRLPRWTGALGVLGVLGLPLLPEAAGPLGSAVAVAATAAVLLRPQGWLGAGPLTWLGQRSYAWYLWHGSALAWLRYLVPRPDWLAIGATVLASLGLAALTRPLLEEPARRRWPARPVIAGSLGLTLLFAGIGWWFGDGHPQRLPEPARQAYAEAHAPWKPPPSEPRVVVWGDSHAHALLPALGDLNPTRFDCAPLVRTWVLDEPPCADEVLAFVEREPVEVVILAAAWSSHVEGRELKLEGAGQVDALYDDGSGADALAVFERRLPQTVAALRDRGVQVWVVKQVPQHEAWVANQLARALAYGGDARVRRPVVEHRARQGRVNHVIDELRDVTVVDPATVLCDRIWCHGARDGRALYLDHHHLTLFGAEQLASLFDSLR